MENNEKKYIKLLLERCLNFNKSKSLLISYDKVNKSFVDNVVEYAKTLGVNDIYLDEDDINTTKEKLENLTLDEIEQDPYFDKTIWDEYAKKDASFLMLETEFPNELEDIDPLKIAKAKYINRTTRELFRKKKPVMKSLGALRHYQMKNGQDQYFQMKIMPMKNCMKSSLTCVWQIKKIQ